MTDPIVYKLISVEDKEIPAENPVLVIYAYPTLQAVIRANVTHWLKPVPLSTLIGEKDKEIAAREKEAEFLNEKINQYVAELSSLKSRVLEMAGDIFDAGVLREREQNLYPFGRNAGQYQYPDKSTYLNNLKEQLK